MSEYSRTHVTGTEYISMRMGKDSDGKDMMQKDAVEKKDPNVKRSRAQQDSTRMVKDSDKDTDAQGSGFRTF
jgi:hypothetical protein